MTNQIPPIPKGRYVLIFGGVGSGKTQTLLPLMRAARERGDLKSQPQQARKTAK